MNNILLTIEIKDTYSIYPRFKDSIIFKYIDSILERLSKNIITKQEFYLDEVYGSYYKSCVICPYFTNKNNIQFYDIIMIIHPSKWYEEKYNFRFYILKENIKSLYLLSKLNKDLILNYIELKA